MKSFHHFDDCYGVNVLEAGPKLLSEYYHSSKIYITERRIKNRYPNTTIMSNKDRFGKVLLET